MLQCLAFTRPITSYLVQGLHSRTCMFLGDIYLFYIYCPYAKRSSHFSLSPSSGQKKGWCFICEFERIILKAREGISPLSPINIFSKLQKIGHLGHGREEDAHEFLR